METTNDVDARSRDAHGCPRTLAVCAGIGGLELGVHLGTAGRSRVVGYLERESWSASTLVARMADTPLDPAPIWDDLSTFQGRSFVDAVGRVDLVTAGFPCQPHSVAGLQDGLEDVRWIWPEIAAVVCDVGPGTVFLENVAGLIPSGGLSAVLGDLARLGFDAEWGLFSAGARGAPHRRRRIFILGWQAEGGPPQWLRDVARGGGGGGDPGSIRPEPIPHAHGRDVRDKPKRGDRGPRPALEGDALLGDLGAGKLAHAGGGGREGPKRAGMPEHQSGPRQPPHGCVGVPGVGGGGGLGLSGAPGRWPPGPRANRADFAPGLEPLLSRALDGGSDRVDRIRALGNGVVPVVAGYALRTLALRAVE